PLLDLKLGRNRKEIIRAEGLVLCQKPIPFTIRARQRALPGTDQIPGNVRQASDSPPFSSRRGPVLSPPSPGPVGLSPEAQHRRRRSRWLKRMHQWHWISSAICLAGMLLFAATGITLNHAARIEASPEVSHWSGQLPPG